MLYKTIVIIIQIIIIIIIIIKIIIITAVCCTPFPLKSHDGPRRMHTLATVLPMQAFFQPQFVINKADCLSVVILYRSNVLE